MEIRSYSRYILTVLCIAVVFTALVLVALSAWMNKPEGAGMLSGLRAGDVEIEEAYRQGYNAARIRYEKMGTIPGDSETRTMNGTVVNTGSKSIVVKQTSLDTDPLVDGVSDDRTVTLAANANVYKETSKSAEEFNRELVAFQRAVANNPDLQPPTASTRQEISLSAIPSGASVRVTSAESVRVQEDIVATEVVYILSTP